MLAIEDFGAAISSSQKALKAIEGKSIRTGHVINLYYDLVRAELELGDLRSARKHYKEGRQLVESSPNWWTPRFDFLEGLLLMEEASPDFSNVKECLERSMKVDEKVGAVVPAAQTHYYLARLLARQGEVGIAREMLTDLSGRFQEWNIPVWKNKCEQGLETLLSS